MEEACRSARRECAGKVVERAEEEADDVNEEEEEADEGVNAEK